jgi:hypothetical protein
MSVRSPVIRSPFSIKEKFAAADPRNAQASFDLATGHVDFAEALSATGDAPQAVEQARQGILILTTLLSADPTNVIYSRNLAIDEEKLGDAFARSGANKNSAKTQRTRAWSAARESYEKAGAIFSALRDRGTLPPADIGMPGKFTALAADCQRAIDELGVVSNTR